MSIKCATLTCLSHLATIDPFAFFDSFDYPTESEFFLSQPLDTRFISLIVAVITFLLSLREHSDPHLRGAFATLLAKLIQTTVRLLTISPPISSLSNSFNSSSINQCSLTSTDSQESSRLGSTPSLSSLPSAVLLCRYSTGHPGRFTSNFSRLSQRQQCTCDTHVIECSPPSPSGSLTKQSGIDRHRDEPSRGCTSA